MSPDTCVIIGVLTFFATTAANRFLGERNYAILSPEDKVKLADAFSTHRSVATYLPIAVMLLVMAVVYVTPQSFPIAFPIGVLLILVISFSLQVAVIRRLSKLSIPVEYIRRFWFQSIVIQIGNVVALSMLAYGFSVRFR